MNKLISLCFVALYEKEFAPHHHNRHRHSTPWSPVPFAVRRKNLFVGRQVPGCQDKCDPMFFDFHKFRVLFRFVLVMVIDVPGQDRGVWPRIHAPKHSKPTHNVITVSAFLLSLHGLGQTNGCTRIDAQQCSSRKRSGGKQSVACLFYGRWQHLQPIQRMAT